LGERWRAGKKRLPREEQRQKRYEAILKAERVLELAGHATPKRLSVCVLLGETLAGGRDPLGKAYINFMGPPRCCLGVGR
jgi:hypothetical protein